MGGGGGRNKLPFYLRYRTLRQLANPVLGYLGVQVDVRGVPQGVDLLLEGRRHPRVAVAHAHRHDAGEEVQVPGQKKTRKAVRYSM